jgi:hypothetical protein
MQHELNGKRETNNIYKSKMQKCDEVGTITDEKVLLSQAVILMITNKNSYEGFGIRNHQNW